MTNSPRFLDSLSAPVHSSPLTIDALSDLFQEFYRRAEIHIGTHVAALSSKLSREKIPRSTPTKKNSQDSAEQQMLTATEISDRKKARRRLELTKVQLEEAVERAVCEKVYMKIWHHRSAEDEQLDQKLRSRIAALSLVGIGLKELLVSGSEDVPEEVRQKTTEQETAIKEALAPARAHIMNMTNEKFPLGKLHHLKDAHKSIVETLSSFFPSTSSADEILPALIYTLITSPPEDVNVISDLHFIQRFRTESKVDGETAYCMVNLEAAISFLETVELPTLRADEPLHGHKRNSFSASKAETRPMDLGIKAASPPMSQTEPFPDLQPADLAPPLHGKAFPQSRSPRRLSELIQAQTNRLEAASDSLRGAVLDSADQAVGALENSLRFLFGRVRETHQPAINAPSPKTLEDARKLVSTPPPEEEIIAQLGESPANRERAASEIGSIKEEPNNMANNTREVLPSTNRVLDLVGGRRPLRDRSVDSSRSGGSGKRVSFAESSNLAPSLPVDKSPLGSPSLTSGAFDVPSTTAPAIPMPIQQPLPTSPPQVSSSLSPIPLAAAGVESMRNLGNTLNPLNQFAKISLFGRSASASAVTLTSAATPTSSPLQVVSQPLVPNAPRLTPAETKRLEAVEDVKKTQIGVVRKFLDCGDAKELRVGEIEELLTEYKKLAVVLGKVLRS